MDMRGISSVICPTWIFTALLLFLAHVYTFIAATHMALSQAANHIGVKQTAVSFLVSHGTINSFWLCDVVRVAECSNDPEMIHYELQKSCL